MVTVHLMVGIQDRNRFTRDLGRRSREGSAVHTTLIPSPQLRRLSVYIECYNHESIELCTVDSGLIMFQTPREKLLVSLSGNSDIKLHRDIQSSGNYVTAHIYHGPKHFGLLLFNFNWLRI